MLLIKAKIKESKIHGEGLFAIDKILKGKKIWEYKPIHPQEQKDLKLVDKVNHSNRPNINYNFRAIRNIEPQEEITINYIDFGLSTDF